MTLYSNYFLKSISQNPFRILGVTANASKKDVIANINKFKAFLKVGKTISGSFDKIEGTYNVDRTIETIDSVAKSIELPIEKLRWTLFWFVEKTPIDKIALNHVQIGNIEKAIEIWSKVKSVASLINLTVSELIQQNWAEAVLYADKLFTEHASSVCSIVDETLDLSTKELMSMFMSTIAEDNYDVLKLLYRAFPSCFNFEELSVDSECRFYNDSKSIDQTSDNTNLKFPCLECKRGGETSYYYFQVGHELNEVEFNKLKENLIFVEASLNSGYHSHQIYHREDIIIPSTLWNNTISTTLAIPFIEKAKHKISTYKAIPNQDLKRRYSYAKSELLNSLNEIYTYLGKNSTEYQTLNNQIVKEALQCAIDFYNKSQEPDDIAREIKDFLWRITLTAIPESVLRQRCKENYDTLCEICSKLPPESVAYYHKLLKNNIDEYRKEASTIQNASIFVNRCFPYLMSIKSVLGSSNAYYQRMCTRVAEDGLEDIITDYNEKSESLQCRLEKATSSNRSKYIKQIQEMMKSAIITMYHLSKLDLESSFREHRFTKNYNIIAKQAREAHALGANSILAYFGGVVSEDEFNKDLKEHAPDIRDEKGYFSSIKSLQDCYTYRSIFPNGKFTNQVNGKVEEYEYQECSSIEDLNRFKIRYPFTKYDIKAKCEEIAFKSCKTIEDYKSYIAKYSTYKKEAEKRIDDLIFGMCRERSSYAQYLANYPSGSHRLEALCKLDDIDYRACKTVIDFDNYLHSYPNGRHVADAKKRLEEEKIWALCIKKNYWKQYQEYLDKYPNGIHKDQAQEKSISPWQKWKKFISNNGCMTTIVLLFTIAIIIGACTNGAEGVGTVFAGFAFLCGCVTIGKGDLGAETRIIALALAVISGLIAYCILSTF